MKNSGNYRHKHINALPEGVHFSDWSNKWLVRVKDEKGIIKSVGQFSDKRVADDCYNEKTSITQPQAAV